MTVQEKIDSLVADNETVEKAKDCALHGLRKRIVDLHHHLIQHADYHMDTTKVSVEELKWWNDVVCGLEEYDDDTKLIEALLVPRYRVLADYPNSNYKVGDTIYDNGKTEALNQNGTAVFFTNKWLELFPSIFKKLEWWQDRKMEELPKYIKHPTGDIEAIEPFLVHFLSDSLWSHSSNLLPATTKEFKAFQATI